MIDSLGVGGAERHLLHMAVYMRGQGVEQVVVQLADDRALSAQFDSHGIDSIDLGCELGIAHYPKMYSKLNKIVRNWQPQVISTQLTASDIVGRLVARRLQIPTISMWQATRYGPIAARAYSPRVRLAMALLRQLDRLSVHDQSCFIAVSKAVEASYLEALSISPTRCEVIPNTVDFGRFPETPPAREKSGGRVRFVHVGIHLLRKGIGTLIEAMALIPPRLDVILDLLGEGPITPELRRQVNALGVSGRVCFNGVLPNVVPVLLSSDVFVLPSLSEGFSLAYLEALAAGLPVIASDIPENREVDPDSRATLFFETGNPRALAERIEKLATDANLRQELGKHARPLVRRYRADEVGPVFYKALLRAAASRPSKGPVG